MYHLCSYARRPQKEAVHCPLHSQCPPQRDLLLVTLSLPPLTHDCVLTRLCPRVEYQGQNTPRRCMFIICSPQPPGLRESVLRTTASHTFTIAFANLKRKRCKTVEIINTLLRTYIINKSLCPTPTQTCIYGGQVLPPDAGSGLVCNTNVEVFLLFFC